MKKFHLTLKKVWYGFLLLLAGVVGFLVFVKRGAVKFPDRPSKYPKGDKPTKTPPPPPLVDWTKKIEKDLAKVNKEHAKLSREELISESNKNYNKKKKGK